MPRKTRSPYRRGLHPNSIAVRFKPGQPSANPKGAPKRRRPKGSIAELLQAHLSEIITVKVDNKRRRMTQLDALVGQTVAEFPRMKPTEKIRALKELLAMLPNGVDFADHQPSQETVEDVVARLAEEARKSERWEVEHERKYGRRP